MNRRNQREEGTVRQQSQRSVPRPPAQNTVWNNPLYPKRVESNVAGVLIAIAAIIAAIVSLVLIVKNFSYPARQHQAYMVQMNADQDQMDLTESQITDDYDIYNYESSGEDSWDYEDGSNYSVNRQDDFAGAGQEEDISESRQGIHTYDVVTGNYYWEEAQQLCEQMGGHLATIDSLEEWDYIINMLREQNTGAYYFYLGGARTADDLNYYWLDETGDVYGDPVNSSMFWGNDLWLEGEPSYQDNGISETYMAILYMKSADRWVLNDVSSNVADTEQYLDGKIAYICEYE